MGVGEGEEVILSLQGPWAVRGFFVQRHRLEMERTPACISHLPISHMEKPEAQTLETICPKSPSETAISYLSFLPAVNWAHSYVLYLRKRDLR